MTSASVIIVTYNSEQTIAGCIDSLLNQSRRPEIIVVDNASKDNTVKVLRGYGKQIKVVESRDNQGFNDGNVKGVAEASGEVLVFLNPDATVPVNFVELICQSCQDLARGVVGCRTQDATGKPQIGGSLFPTLGSLLYDSSQFQKFFPNSSVHRNFLMKDWSRKTSRFIDAVPGACFGLRRSVYDQIGGFDTKYFLFFEEYDLGRSIQRIGLRTYFDSSIVITHLGHTSTDQIQSDEITKIYHQSRDYYVRKHHGLIFLVVFKALCRLFNLAWSLRRKLPIGYNS